MSVLGAMVSGSVRWWLASGKVTSVNTRVMKNLRDACTRTKSVCACIRGRARPNVMRLC